MPDCISNYIPDPDETEYDERDAQLQQMRDEAQFARRKAHAITKLLSGLPLDLMSVPTERLLLEWMVKGLNDEAKLTENVIREREQDHEDELYDTNALGVTR